MAPEGEAFVVTKGDAVGSRSVLLPVLVIGIALFVSGKLADIYGVAIAALGMLAFVGATVSIDAFGPIADNAGGLAESCHLDANVRVELFDPDATWKRQVVTDYTWRDLKKPIFRGGELVYERPSLAEIKAYSARELDTLWDEVKRFDNPHNYYVDLSPKLWKLKNDLLMAGGALPKEEKKEAKKKSAKKQ